MGIFKKSQKNQEIQDNEQEIQNKNQKEVKNKINGKFINLKIIKIGVAVIVLLIIYSIFTGNNNSNKKDEKSQNVGKISENKLDNPYSGYKYSNVQDFDKNVQNDVKDISENLENNTQQNENNNVKNGLSEEQKEQLQMLQEQALQAKKSPIAFTLNTNQQPQSNRNVNQQMNSNEVDYDQNRQNSKKSFLYNESQDSLYSTNQIVKSISPYELKTGDFFPAVVETTMNSDIFSKVIVARVSQNIFDTVTGKYLLIPQGTVLTGVYDSNITWGQNRLLVIWQRLMFPNGDMLKLNNLQGVDMLGQAGLNGKVNNHFATLLKGVLLSSAMGSAAAITTSNNNDDWRGKAGEGAGYSIVQIGDKFASKALERQPTIVIRAGDRFNVMVQSNLILKPYED